MVDVPDPEINEKGEVHLPASRPKFRTTLVDAGMVAQLNDEESITFIGLMSSLGEGNGRAAAEFALRFSVGDGLAEDERDAFIKDMTELFSQRCRGYGTDVDVGDVLRGVLALIRVHRVRIDANFATLVINALCVESLANRVCPSYNILDASRPLLETYRKICFEEDGITPRDRTKALKVTSFWSLIVMYLSSASRLFDFFNRK